ncbi:MAG TPA: hypothetical protein VGO47_04805, partial [Chlamydiales bacterium]|nr:hypothetical protein [Chlamydiales bacterium]
HLTYKVPETLPPVLHLTIRHWRHRRIFPREKLGENLRKTLGKHRENLGKTQGKLSNKLGKEGVFPRFSPSFPLEKILLCL